MTDLYHDFKLNNNYTRLEIEQKEEALKNTLIPITLDEYYDILKNTGFKHIEILFKYLNFQCLIAIK